jgi:UDP-3-O-[3-hydroxymyristoyl] glucosamine N-acyltransferase
VHRNIPDGERVLGSPAIPGREQKRIFQMIARLPEMHRQLRELSAQIALLTSILPHDPVGGLGAASDEGRASIPPSAGE